MKWIFNSKNLTKKIFVFFLLFFIFGGIRNTNAEILKFGFGSDTTTCKDNLNNCRIESHLKKDFINNPNFRFANTSSNLNDDLSNTDYKVTDFNISLENFIKQRLYLGNNGYFGSTIDNNFSYFDNDFNTFANSLSTTDKKNIDLLTLTLGSNVETQDKRFEVALNVTKALGNSTTGSFSYENLQIATLTYYYLKIYKILDQYLIINNVNLPANAVKDLVNIKDNLRKNIYYKLYKTDSIGKASGCTTDGTDLDKCSLFTNGEFEVDGSGDNLKLNVMSDVNSLKLDASKYSSDANKIKLDTSIVNADPNTRPNRSMSRPPIP